MSPSFLARWFGRRFARRTPYRKAHSNRIIPSIERLGDRILPALTVSFANGFLVISGDNADDVAVVSTISSGQILLNNAATGHTISDTTRILVAGNGGNDRLDISALNTLQLTVSPTLDGGAGSDVLVGSAGRDILIGGRGGDTIDGRNDIDQVRETLDANFTLTNTSLVAQGGNILESDVLTSVEQAFLTGGASANVINATAFTGRAILHGEGGNDTLIGGIGNDDLAGQDGNDTMRGNGGTDRFEPGNGFDVVDGGAGTDTVIEQNSFFILLDTALGGRGTDTLTGIEQAILTGDDGDNKMNAALFTGRVTMIGGAGDDVLTGGSGNDRLEGGTGDDVLSGLQGNDTLDGGTGTDRVSEVSPGTTTLTNTSLAGTAIGKDSLVSIEQASLTGGSGNDVMDAIAFSGNVTMRGEAGNDSLSGGLGSDFLDGGLGNDTLRGNFGSDSLTGGAGNDRIDGGVIGFDTIIESASGLALLTNSKFTNSLGSDVLTGIEGAILTGGSGADNINASGFTGRATINGGAGNDQIGGGFGDDLLQGGDGVDTITGGRGDDTIDGGAGTDTLVETVRSASADFTLSDASLVSPGFDTDVLVSINRAQLFGGSGDNTMNASAFSGPVTLKGGAGNDRLTGGSGDDLIEGGAGNDTMTGGLGDDTLQGGDGNDLLIEAADVSFILSDSSLEGLGDDDLSGINRASLTGGAGNNRLNASAFDGDVILKGGRGNDTLTGGSGDDSLLGEDGDDVLDGDAGNDSLIGALGNDKLTGGTGDDFFDGGFFSFDTIVEIGNVNFTLTDTSLTGLGNDTMVNNIDAAVLIGGIGNNRIDASAFTGPVKLDGNGGNDTLVGGDFDDELIGGSGDDVLVARGGHDSLNGSTGNDTLEGGADDDTLSGGAGADAMDGGSGTDVLDELITASAQVTLSPTAMVTRTTVNGVTTTVTDTLAGFQEARLDATSAGSAGVTLDATAFIGSVELQGSAGNDLLVGGSDDDRILGNGGNDVLAGNAGNDEIRGGAGDDFIQGGAGNDTLQGEAGTDTVTEEGDVNFTLTPTTLVGVGTDVLSGFERAVLTGGDSANVINAAAFNGPVTLSGGGGADVLTGTGFADLLSGGAGNDTINGGAGNDTLDGGAGNDLLNGQDGNDFFSGGSGNDSLLGGNGNDNAGLTDLGDFIDLGADE